MNQQCKFEEITEAHELMKKSSAELYACGCEKCAPIAKEKELVELRAEKQKQLAEEAVREEEAKKIEALEQAQKSWQKALDQVREEVRGELMEEKGIDKGFLNNPLFQAHMSNQYAAAKNIHLNTQYGRDELSPEMKSFVHYAKTGQPLYKDAMRRDGTDTQQIVPVEFHNEVQRKVTKMVTLRSAGARTFTVNTGDLDIPLEGARGQGAWMEEGGEFQTSNVGFEMLRLSPYKYGRIIQATEEFLQDSPVQVVNYLSDVFAEDIANAEEQAFWNGDGSGKPRGIIYQANNATGDDAIQKIAYEGPDSLIHALGALPSRAQGSAEYFMHPGTLNFIRTLADNSGRYLFANGNAGLVEGIPGQILGRNVRISDFIPEGTVVVGLANRYYIGEGEGFSVRRSDEYGFHNGTVAFRMHKRVDGKVSFGDYFKVITGVQASASGSTVSTASKKTTKK